MVKVRADLPTLNAESASPSREVDCEQWLAHIQAIYGNKPLPLLSQACLLVENHVQGATHHGRSDAFATGIDMADMLAHFAVDEDVLTAAMVFRAVREQILSPDLIRQQFGQIVSELVSGVAAMGRLSDLIEQKRRHDTDLFEGFEQPNSIYKMLISVTEDVRVVLIKLAERTFAIRELEHASPDRQRRVAKEVMTIYAPLAHRLGMAQIKWELEDLAFRFLAAERYKEIARLLNEKRIEREAFIEKMKMQLESHLAKLGVKFEIFGRVKHIYSIYRKMRDKQLSFDQLYDIRALRVLVENSNQCYQVLGIVHQLWRHIPNQFDDYITNPKANGYRSLHTAVIADNKSMEVQIRTFAMHQEAEIGVCAHFSYKEGGGQSNEFQVNHKLYSLRAVLEAYLERQVHDEDYDDDSIGRLQEWGELEKIYVFSRDGDIRELSADATVLDFAYHIHTEVGNHCYAALVNNRYVPLNYRLKTGQQVEILTRDDQEPNRDWLVNSLGYINTVHARDKLKHWFRQQEKSKTIQIGHELLGKELSRLSIHPNSIDLSDYATYFGLKHADDLLMGIVTGDVQVEKLMKHISSQVNVELEKTVQIYRPMISPDQLNMLEDNGVLIDIMDPASIRPASCCSPLYDQPIAGYLIPRNTIVVHRQSCETFTKLRDSTPQAVVELYWDVTASNAELVNIQILAHDRRGLLKDVTTVIFSDQINIFKVNTLTQSSGMSELKFQLEVKGLAQLSRLLARLEQIAGVISAKREPKEAS